MSSQEGYVRTPKKVEVYPWIAKVKTSRGRNDEGWYWVGRCFHQGKEWPSRSRRCTTRDDCARWLETLGRPWEWEEAREDAEGDESPLGLGELLTAYTKHQEVEKAKAKPGAKTWYHVPRKRWESVSPSACLLPVDEVDGRTLEDHIGRALTANYASSTIRQDIICARAALNWGLNKGLDVIVPAFPDIPDTGPRYRSATPSESGVMDVAEHLLKTGSPWAGYGVALLWCWGARPGELAHLERDRVWLGDRVALLDGKTGQREIPLSRHAVALIEACYALPGRKNWRTVLGVAPATAETMLWRLILEACAELGQRPWTPKGLRSAATDRIYESGDDPKVEARLLGHSEQTALNNYRKVRARQASATAERLGTLPAGRVLLFPCQNMGVQDG